ncbi:MAG: DUF4115 domain-containing protein [Pseudomonadales bacterium]|nr:DUF4115 domain-containing protein [Pseudomonadales bacterium]
MPTEQVADEFDEDSVNGNLPLAGETLRQERQRQNLSEKEVADQLHITMHYVKAIESDNYEKLPGSVFAKGYVKSYAELLELDPDSVLELYDQYTIRLVEKEKEKTLIQVRRRRDKNRPWVVLSIVGFIGGFAGLWAYNNFVTVEESSVAVPEISSPTEEVEEPEEGILPNVNQDSALNTPAPSPANTAVLETAIETVTAANSASSQEAAADTEPATDDFISALSALANDPTTEDIVVNAADQDFFAAPTEIAEPEDRIIEITSAGSDVLRIAFTGESWVEINDEEQNQIYRDIRGAGDILEITGNAPFSILLGDAPFTSLTFNGTEIDVSANIRIDNSARLTVGL